MSNLKKLLPFLAIAVLLAACIPAEASAPEEVAFVASTEELAMTESAPTEDPESITVPLPATQAEFCVLADMPENCLIDESMVLIIAEQTGIECELQPGEWSSWMYSGDGAAGQTQSGTLSCPDPSQEDEATTIDFAVTIDTNYVVGVVVGGEPAIGAPVNLKVVGNGNTHIMDAAKDKGNHNGWEGVDGEVTDSQGSSDFSGNPPSESDSVITTEASPLPGCDSSGGKPKKCNP